MLYNSYSFLLFFPIALLLYFVTPKKIRYITLLILSYYFYMSWDPRYVVLLLFLTVLTYTGGRLIGKADELEDEQRKTKRKKLILGITVVAGLTPLFYFKYIDFIISSLNRILELIGMSIQLPTMSPMLPVGISFLTLTALTYPIDVYRNEMYVEKRILRYALFVSFFTNIAAGPIERSKRLLRQVAEPTEFSFDRFRLGLFTMLWGYFMKLVLAERITLYVDTAFGNMDQYPGWYLIVAFLLYAVQIYCDFAGYSNMAFGAAEILGFDVFNNFNAPYLSRSVAEFWRRWHISLSSWFRDYLYIPLGGNRKGKARKYLNIMIVFIVSGLWHGATWSFVIWGALNGIYQIIGAVLMPLRKKAVSVLRIDTESVGHRLYQTIVTFLLIDFSWVFFRAGGVRTAFSVLKQAFTVQNPWILFDKSIFSCGLDRDQFALLAVAILLLLLVDICRYSGIRVGEVLLRQHVIVRWICFAVAVTSILVFGIWGPGFSASNFIYIGF